ncbi:aminotransferase class V-fold PLP-dependent enzyme [Vallitalea sp.]|jgi:selenocysteine lyase/cysteine desulfurase|uniref:aminotransferase class V-fold PLP-dependent enzyme n=1 Tax=Vallitalea sp. TaxID=1882829 RepID=UPI0025EE9CDE|nr:aminotransferase class V-fold PLP-dependent enzyme [Vallitalea sp.]MCT4688124.1 aminotransferase class V-fold PLP-dependent enzyme [Vallitalea sp.]
MHYYSSQPNYKYLVVGTDVSIPLSNGKYTKEINFDNAATTPPLTSVMEAINDFAPWYSSIHRGTGYKSNLSSEIYDATRKTVADFVNMDRDYSTVIFVKNTTEAINKVSNKLSQVIHNGIILSSFMEHHSNDLPWRKNFNMDYINLDNKGNLSLEDCEQKLKKYKGKVRLVTISGASNVTGYKTDIHEFAKLAHRYGAKILIDGAQLIPHSPIDMKPSYTNDHIDYLVFSGHKIYAPFGTGVLIGPKNVFKYGSPTQVGGGTVKIVTPSSVMWDDVPYKEEAGTPNIMGVVALNASLMEMKKLGMYYIENMELNLTEYTLNKLNKIKDVIIYGNENDCDNRIGIITFNIKGLHHSVVANILSEEAGISVRSGCFCAQPYVQKLLYLTKNDINKLRKNPRYPRPGMVRISFGLYNDYSEVDILIELIEKIIKNKSYYLKKYPSKHHKISSSARY